MRPEVGAGGVVGGGPGGGPGDGLWEGGEGGELGIDGWVLAGGADPVWEDVFGGVVVVAGFGVGFGVVVAVGIAVHVAIGGRGHD